LGAIERDIEWASVRKIEEVTVVSPDREWSCVVSDAECDPRTWEITYFRIRRPWWAVFGTSTLQAANLVEGGSDVLLVNPRMISRGFPTRF
jgi:hypothetical protein